MAGAGRRGGCQHGRFTTLKRRKAWFMPSKKYHLRKKGNEQKILTSFLFTVVEILVVYSFFVSFGDQILLALITIMEAL